MPIVDGIKWENLEHLGYSSDTKSVGIFEWGFLYKEMTISNDDFAQKKYATEPSKYILSPFFVVANEMDFSS